MKGTNAVTWFEIPARDLERASRFYARVLGRPLQREVMDGAEMAVFPHAAPGVSGCVQKGEPHRGGTMIYLDVGSDLEQALSRVHDAGGSVVRGKTALPGDLGHFAHIVDTEGNRVGLHAFAR